MNDEYNSQQENTGEFLNASDNNRNTQNDVPAAENVTSPDMGAQYANPNEYRVYDRPNTTQHGYGQGYAQEKPYQQPAGVYYQNNQGYQGGNYGQPQQQFNSAPNSYQYNPNSGWQTPQQHADNYQWNLHDYEKAAGEKTKKKRSRGLVVFAVSLICVLSLGVIGVSTYGLVNYINKTQTAENAEREPVSEQPADESASIDIASRPSISESLPVGGKLTIPQVAKAVLPSVVGVVQYRPDMYLEETGAGSGIIMSGDGYIITNAHVVAGGTDFKILLSDGTPKDAELIGSDPQTDLAVLKIIDAGDLTPATFGDSDALQVGESVIAIGNPGGDVLAGSVTQGIVSAVNREIPNAANLPLNIPLIQTDAAINPGNSGGALVNEYGQIIGINSSKIVATGYEGIGFAIPISAAKPIIEDIVANGRVTGRVKLGISARDIDAVDARSSGLVMGIRIEAIDPESDLAQKGVQKFDIITHIDGEQVYNTYDLKKILEPRNPGDVVRLTLYRPIGMTRHETFDVDVVLMEDN